MESIQAKSNQGSSFRSFNRSLGIFLISVLGLFVEMLLIRWIGTEIRIFAYLQNTILVACFLGLGLGSFSSHKQINLRFTLIPLGFLLFYMAIPIVREGLGLTSELLSVYGDLLIWRSLFVSDQFMTIVFLILGLSLTYFVLIIHVDIFVPLCRVLARMLNEHPNIILAYSLNIAGSLVGTWLFVVLSFFTCHLFIGS